MIMRAKRDGNWRHAYQVEFNMSIFGIYNPDEIVRWHGGEIDRMLASGNIGKDGQHRIGFIKFDYYEHNLDAVHNVIRANVGCGGL